MNSVITLDQLASLLGIGPRRIQQLVQEGVIPKPKGRGQYDSEGAIKGYIAYLNKALNDGPADLNTYRKQLTKAQAEKEELLVEKLRGDLLERAEIIQTWGNMVSNMKARLLAIPTKTSGLLLGLDSQAQIQQILKASVMEALNELAAMATDETSDKDSQKEKR